MKIIASILSTLYVALGPWALCLVRVEITHPRQVIEIIGFVAGAVLYIFAFVFVALSVHAEITLPECNQTEGAENSDH